MMCLFLSIIESFGFLFLTLSATLHSAVLLIFFLSAVGFGDNDREEGVYYLIFLRWVKGEKRLIVSL